MAEKDAKESYDTGAVPQVLVFRFFWFFFISYLHIPFFFSSFTGISLQHSSSIGH